MDDPLRPPVEQQLEDLATLLDGHRHIGFLIDAAVRLLREAADEVALLRSELAASLDQRDAA